MGVKQRLPRSQPCLPSLAVPHGASGRITARETKLFSSARQTWKQRRFLRLQHVNMRYVLPRWMLRGVLVNTWVRQGPLHYIHSWPRLEDYDTPLLSIFGSSCSCSR